MDQQNRFELPERVRHTRATHTRSRNGCQECRRRHVRCDEKQPLCTNCLTRGATCVYDRLTIQRSQESFSAAIMPNVMHATPVDPFDTLEVEMPYDTPRLLHHFISYRNELRKLVSGNVNIGENVIPVKYEGSSAYKRGLLLMSAKHRYGLTGKTDYCREPTFLYHKTEVIRLLKEQLDTNPVNPVDWSFSVIFFLVAMESLEGNTDAAEAHIRGLMILMKTKLPQDHGLYESAQILLRLGLLVLSLLEAAKMDNINPYGSDYDWLLSKTPFGLTYRWQWVNVVYLLMQMVGEFLVNDDGLIIVAAPAGPETVASLRWLAAQLRSVRLAEQDGVNQDSDSESIKRYEDSQLKKWALAGACYALLLASLSPSKRDDRSNNVTPELVQLHSWWEMRISEWLESLTLPSRDFALEVLNKLAWLTSVEGEKVIEQLQGDSTIDTRV